MLRYSLLAVAAVAALAGCSAASPTPKVASAAGTPSAAASQDEITAYVAAQRKWVQCLRAQGIDVADPDSKGKVEFGGNVQILRGDPRWIAAQAKCQPLVVPQPASLQNVPTLSPDQLAKEQQYAKCMRANGAPDFPDPTVNGFPTSGSGPSATPDWNENTDGARRATRICEPIVNGPATQGPGVG